MNDCSLISQDINVSIAIFAFIIDCIVGSKIFVFCYSL